MALSYGPRRPPRKQAVLVGDESERSYQDRIIELLKLRGWELVYHTWDSTHSPAGFPDIIAVRRGRGLALEVKSQHGDVKPRQRRWIEEFDRVPGFQARVVRPSDWVWVVEVAA